MVDADGAAAAGPVEVEGIILVVVVFPAPDVVIRSSRRGWMAEVAVRGAPLIAPAEVVDLSVSFGLGVLVAVMERSGHLGAADAAAVAGFGRVDVSPAFWFDTVVVVAFMA